jgi:hypothetical protein
VKKHRTSAAVAAVRLSLTLGAFAACGGERAEGPVVRRPLSSSPAASSDYRSPASWLYHPEKEASLVARVTLEDGSVLYAGRRGERWLVDGEGRARPAAGLAPETLVAIEPVAGDRWVFIGESGTRYEAPEPLGPFSSASAPFDDIVRLAVHGSVLVGIGRDGHLIRRDGDEPWQAVGPEEPRMVSVALGAAGIGLALSVPESLWATKDSGISWARLETPARGATGVAADEELGIVVETVLGPMRWEPKDPRGLVQVTRSPARARYQLGVPAPLGPSGEALAAGRAIVSAGSYRELRAGAKPLTYDFVVGSAVGSLSRMAAPSFDGCRAVRLAGADRVLVVACVRAGEASIRQPIEVHRSEDGGKTFRREPYALEGILESSIVAVAPDGTTVLSGVCSPEAAGRACRAAGIFRRTVREKSEKDGGAAIELEKVPAPGLEGAALAVAFAPSASRAIAIGKSSKTSGVALFVSDDRVQHFSVHDVNLPAAPGEPRGEPRTVAVRTLGTDDTATAFVIDIDGNVRLVVVDEAGNLLAQSAPPGKGASIGVAGVRALAVLPPSGDTWESLDAGASWNPVGRVPLEVCARGRVCGVPVVCHVSGCVVGEQLSRSGWQGQGDAILAASLSPNLRRAVARYVTRVEPPYSCVLHPGDWSALPPHSTLPDADRSGFEGVDWFTVADDPATASVTVVRARGGARPGVETLVLLSPLKGLEQVAFAASLQVEGAAALRYALPKGEAQRSVSLEDVEIAWVDLLSGSRGRGRIADGGPYEIGDYERAPGTAQRARPALLSIGSDGVYVRLHAARGDRQVTYFLDGRNVEPIHPPDWPPDLLTYGRSEMARVDGRHVALRLSEVAVARMVESRGSWTLQAEAVGFRHPGDFGIAQHFDIAYAKGRSGLHVTFDDEEREVASAFIRPFSAGPLALEAALPVPAQSYIQGEPRSCSQAIRTTTPRVVAPHQAGTRHPVIVADALEPLRVFLTDRAVLHGTPEAPCVLTYDAELVSTESDDRNLRFSAILPIDHLDRAWLLRQPSSGRRNDESRVEYRMMSCRYDPTAEVPAEVYRAKGTAVR